MTVRLVSSRDLAAAGEFDVWVPIAAAAPDVLPADMRRPTARELEQAFAGIAQDWFSIARDIARNPGGELTHTGSCAANITDFGLMLAWGSLVREWAGEETKTLVLCDDPWMFRHLAGLPGVTAGTAPPLFRREIMLRLRGIAARAACALRVARANIALRAMRSTVTRGERCILVYGHPRSNTDGYDGYFGDLMRTDASIRRVLHVDCGVPRARALAVDGRTVSLHAWGSLRDAAPCLAARWRPGRALLSGPYGWLVRRAGALDGGTAQAAIIRWQNLCQARWLADTAPVAVAWPWENHAWERSFVAACRARGTRTIGYQHSVVGRQMINYSPASNPAGEDGLPDRIHCTGRATAQQLEALGNPGGRIAVAGALRFEEKPGPKYDPAAPAFLALPFDNEIGREMVAAAARVADGTHRFLVKDHPMTPCAFEETEFVRRTQSQLNDLAAVSSVIYSATTVGLEALLMGLPTYRFLPSAKIGMHVLPPALEVQTVAAAEIGKALDCPARPAPVERSEIFAPVDRDIWSEALRGC